MSRYEYMVQTIQGDYLIDAADLDDFYTQFAYRNGQCFSLAYAFYQRGLPLVGIVENVEYDDPVWDAVHYLAVLPNGCYIDIDGVHSPETIDNVVKRFHGEGIIPLTAGDVNTILTDECMIDAMPEPCLEAGFVTMVELAERHQIAL